MGTLIVTDGNGQIREFTLEKERTSVGRHPDNDIVLGDKAVSGRHALIITVLGDSFLEDLGSTNGTQVNGRRIDKHPLSHGDIVTIGRNTLHYQSQNPLGEELEQTLVLRPDPVIRAAPPPAPPPPAAPAKPQLGTLNVVSGPNLGKTLDLAKALTTIGKPGVQVAAITRRADGYYIVHVGGGGETRRALVNGQEITLQARRLNDGDTIELLGTQMRFSLT
ncbi:FHA domain-containing protein [Solimonas marina]|uniref:FHA domain-containing protein n=1 Tax=Solimonas marina TaxID=2714601 RepID=A0A970B4N7_9GAMM|nr:FHA domain-containing protein [Solimonas marina]NKF22522.1 FHA domain-containing protein [Solimonas marina]